MAGEETITKVSNTMVTLNKDASIAMQEVGVSACTDITGFGLLGHLSEMIRGNGFGMIVYAGKVPYFPEAKEFAGMGMVPGGTYRNKDFFLNGSDLIQLFPSIFRIFFLTLKPPVDF